MGLERPHSALIFGALALWLLAFNLMTGERAAALPVQTERYSSWSLAIWSGNFADLGEPQTDIKAATFLQKVSAPAE
jgi:hypothetical protein